jgi:hypothetical protein
MFYRTSSLLIDHQNPVALAFITEKCWALLLLTEKSQQRMEDVAKRGQGAALQS